MKEELKSFAFKFADSELEKLCAYSYKELSKGKSVNVSKQICASLNEDGILSSVENDGVYIMNLHMAQEKLSNRIWLEDKVMSKIAKSKAVKIETGQCKHQVEYGTEEAKKKGLNSGIPGRIYCSLWKTQVENVVQVDGRCVPTKYLTQGTPDSGTNQWGSDKEFEGHPIGNIKNAQADKKKKIFARQEEIRPEIIDKYLELFGNEAELDISVAIQYPLNDSEKFYLLQNKKVPYFFIADMVKDLENNPKYISTIIEEHLANYKDISPSAFKEYLKSISNDDTKIFNVLLDKTVKELPFYKDIVLGYYSVIENNPDKLLNIISKGFLQSNEATEFEKQYLNFIKSDVIKLKEILSTDNLKAKRGEYEKAYYNLISDNDAEVEKSISDGIISEDNIGEERIKKYLDKIYKNEDELLKVINSNKISEHTLQPFLKNKRIRLEDYKNPELQEKLLELFEKDNNTLSNWFETTKDEALKSKIFEFLGENFKKIYRYKFQNSEEIFENTKPNIYKDYLEKMDMNYKENYEILRKIILTMNESKIKEWSWSDFKKQNPRLAARYPELMNNIRKGGGIIKLEWIEEEMNNIKKTQKYPISFQTYDAQQIRTKSQDLVIQINAPNEIMEQIEADPYLRAYWSYLHGEHGTTGRHPSPYNNIGWVRIDLVNEVKTKDGKMGYVIIDEFQSDFLDSLAHSNIKDVIKSSLYNSGLLEQIEKENKTLDQIYEYIYNMFFNTFKFQDWMDWGMSKVFEFARQNNVDKVVMLSQEDKMGQYNFRTNSVAKQYYTELPKNYGFNSVPAKEIAKDIPEMDKYQNVWVRKASKE